eukprot:2336641-Prymnesium_polylepis.1
MHGAARELLHADVAAGGEEAAADAFTTSDLEWLRVRQQSKVLDDRVQFVSVAARAPPRLARPRAWRLAPGASHSLFCTAASSPRHRRAAVTAEPYQPGDVPPTVEPDESEGSVPPPTSFIESEGNSEADQEASGGSRKVMKRHRYNNTKWCAVEP